MLFALRKSSRKSVAPVERQASISSWERPLSVKMVLGPRRDELDDLVDQVRAAPVFPRHRLEQLAERDVDARSSGASRRPRSPAAGARRGRPIPSGCCPRENEPKILSIFSASETTTEVMRLGERLAAGTRLVVILDRVRDLRVLAVLQRVDPADLSLERRELEHHRGHQVGLAEGHGARDLLRAAVIERQSAGDVRRR